MKAFFRVLNTTSRLVATRYYAREDTSVSQFKVSLLRCRTKKRASLTFYGFFVAARLYQVSPIRREFSFANPLPLETYSAPYQSYLIITFLSTFRFSSNQIL